MGALIQVSTTLPSEAAANQLARQLVEKRLAACVQVSGPLTSIYRWQGEIEQGQEWLCTAKTTADAFARIAEAIAAAHPYDVPEIIATPLVDVSAGYAEWLRREVE
jgi:periplasmic divalent cation tolerance protein